MSHQHEHDENEDHLEEDDIIEIHEDDDEGDIPMDEDDDEDGNGIAVDGEGYESDGDNAKYDGEIVIGEPANAEEEAEWEEYQRQQGLSSAPAEDNSWNATALHTSQQSIFTLSLHPKFPNPPLAVSGGEDDCAFIFSPVPKEEGGSGFNGESFNAVKLTGHTDSVVATGWSFDGEMVATGGMDGRVRVWRRVKGRKGSPAPGSGGEAEWKDWEFLTGLETGSEVQWLTWHPKGNVLAAGCEDSSIWLWQLPSGNTLTVLSAHTLATTCGLFPPPLGRQLLTTSLDSTLILWEISSSTPIFKSSIFSPPNNPEQDPSESGITSLAIAPNGKICAVGSAHGLVKVVGLENGVVLATLKGHGYGESVEALKFVDLLNGAGGGKGVVLVSGGTDGKGFVWDVTTGRVRAELSHKEPITSLAPHPHPNLHLVTSASADGELKTWDIRTGALIATHKGHAGVVNGVVVGPAPEGSEAKEVVLSAGDEGVSLIWKV